MMEGIVKKDFSHMDFNHHLLSGFKALFSEEAINMIDVCRRSCGGAGFHAFSGFTEIYQNHSPIPTYEGDNIVMSLQASRYIFKLFKAAKKGTKLSFPFEYINQIPEL
jgi:hypothetical protein